jgi:hypothetical protein
MSSPGTIGHADITADEHDPIVVTTSGAQRRALQQMRNHGQFLMPPPGSGNMHRRLTRAWNSNLAFAATNCTPRGRFHARVSRKIETGSTKLVPPSYVFCENDRAGRVSKASGEPGEAVWYSASAEMRQ